ncbi:MAG: hypothetical protein EOO72_06910, partial [Myxococcaceae bacterium]
VAGALEAPPVLQIQQPVDTLHHFPVTAVEVVEGVHWLLDLEDGRRFEGTGNHRVRTEAAWEEVRHLAAGARLLGARPGVVRQVTRGGRGPVVRITVAGAHTYVSSGFLSHNVKKADPTVVD